MNHINEGIVFMAQFAAINDAKKAYCIHPLFQADNDLIENIKKLDDYDPLVVAHVMEYRSVANEYLSKNFTSSTDKIRLSPLKGVNDMLRADKWQNYKDFRKYHFDSHPKSAQLYGYFWNWAKALSIENHFKKIDEEIQPLRPDDYHLIEP